MRILIADDQKRTRQSLKLLLKTVPSGIEMREAINGHEAVNMVREFLPDVVLMDARMPGMDGVEATRLIKASWSGVKVIMLSMYPEYLEAAFQAGVDAYISKGQPPEELLEAICAMLSLSRSDE